jgi:hypothetical protein
LKNYVGIAFGGTSDAEALFFGLACGRVIEEVETGSSRREAAERYGLSPSVVVIWMQRFEKTGSVAAGAGVMLHPLPVRAKGAPTDLRAHGPHQIACPLINRRC